MTGNEKSFFYRLKRKKLAYKVVKKNIYHTMRIDDEKSENSNNVKTKRKRKLILDLKVLILSKDTISDIESNEVKVYIRIFSIQTCENL